jgi:alcohol dehydrogenase
VDLVRSLSKSIGIPEHLRELGVPESDIEDMAEMAMTVARPIENNPRKMSREAAVQIYREAF